MHTNSSIDSKASAKAGVKKAGAKTRAKSVKVTKSEVTPTNTSETLHLKGQATMDVGKVAEAAYYLAEHRRFAPGHEVEDWLQAEQQVSAAASHRH